MTATEEEIREKLHETFEEILNYGPNKTMGPDADDVTSMVLWISEVRYLHKLTKGQNDDRDS